MPKGLSLGGISVYQRVKKQKLLTVGISTTVKALNKGQVTEVFIARDADRRIVNSVIALCKEQGVKISWVDCQVPLGRAAGVVVGASTVGFLRE
jgi:large subunit ribosomal protein L7A